MTMDSKSARDVGSAIAVVLSLVFVGWEIRQNTQAQKAQTRQELANSSREWVMAAASMPHLYTAYRDIFEDPDTTRMGGARSGIPYTREDTIAARAMIHANLRNVENVYLQTLEGVVDRSVLTTYGFQGAIWHSRAFTAYWLTRRQLFDSAFVREFEETHGIEAR